MDEVVCMPMDASTSVLLPPIVAPAPIVVLPSPTLASRHSIPLQEVVVVPRGTAAVVVEVMNPEAVVVMAAPT